MLMTLLLAVCASAWDVSYEGNVMPNSSALGTSRWNVGQLDASSTDGDVLHLVDTALIECSVFRQPSGMATDTSFTIETRVKVLSLTTTGKYGLSLWVSAPSNGMGIGLWPDKVWVGAFEPGTRNPICVPVDMTQFHTFRLATPGGSDKQYSLWMDGVLLYTGSTQRAAVPEVSIAGEMPMGTAYDSYWDYVRYSTEYMPVPEASALMTLAGGLGALALPLMRKKRRR